MTTLQKVSTEIARRMRPARSDRAEQLVLFPSSIEDRLRRTSPFRQVLIAMILLFVIIFGTLSYRQHVLFGTFGFDLGIFDQGLWLLSRFQEPFVTVRGLNFFGNHLNITSVLLVPFYWFGAGPQFLNIVQVLAIATGAIPLWMIARERLANEWIALSVAAAYLLNPTLEWGAQWNFHPDALAITPFLFSYYFLIKKNWRWFALCIVLVLLAKEDTSLTVFAFGAFIALKHDRKVGLITSLAGLGWLLIATKLLIPWANGGEGTFYEALYGDFGSDIVTIGRNVLFHPGDVLGLALEEGRLTYFWQLLAPIAFLAILAPGTLAIIGPQLLANILSVQPYTYQIRYQYSLLIMTVLFLATVEAIHRVRSDPGVRGFMVGALVVAALATNVAWSPSPIGSPYDEGIWAQPAPEKFTKRQGLALIPAEASVSATYYLVPQLTHRTAIYEYPNPWSPANWGVSGQATVPPSSVDYLAIDTGLLSEEHIDLYRNLTAAGGEFEVIWSDVGVEISKRAG